MKKQSTTMSFYLESFSTHSENIPNAAGNYLVIPGDEGPANVATEAYMIASSIIELIEDPRVTGGLLCTLRVMLARVHQDPSAETRTDAISLLALARLAIDPPTMVQETIPAQKRSVLDVPAQRAALLLSIAAARSYHMAEHYGTVEDASVLRNFMDRPDL